jgi:hypothetical protein
VPEQATIVDFISASLMGLEKSGRSILTPNEQSKVDVIATSLDRELDVIVHELERVASCQQEAEDPSGEPLPPFTAFCVGLQSIGDSLLPHLSQSFLYSCEEKGVPPGPFIWIVRARADAFVAYLLQIAQVHGLAFDESLTKMGKAEQIALANLGAYLRALMQQEIDKITQKAVSFEFQKDQ